MRDDEPRPGTGEEPGTLTQGAPVFPGSSRLGIEPKTPGCVCLLLQDLLQSCSRVCVFSTPLRLSLSALREVCIQYSVMFFRGNGVTLRTQKVIQGGDNGHVGRPC